MWSIEHPALQIKKDQDKYSFQKQKETSSEDIRFPDLTKNKTRVHGSHNNLLAFLNQRNQKEVDPKTQMKNTVSTGVLRRHELGRNSKQDLAGKVTHSQGLV